MSPKLRGNGRPWGRRVRRWAAPVVLTFALAPLGCTKDKDRGDERTSNPPGPSTTNDANAPIGNADKPPVKAADAGTPNQIARAALVGEIHRHDKDGPCELDLSVQCAPDTKCNPPAPRAVDCGQIPNADGMTGSVFRGDDGKCRWEQETRCPPNVPCNPPAPVDVPCPE